MDQISGNLLEDIGFTFPNLQLLTVSLNQFFGTIPLSISIAINLIILQLEGNELSGKVLSSVNLHNVRMVTLFTTNIWSGGFDANELNTFTDSQMPLT